MNIDHDRQQARELALLARSGLGGTRLREAAIAEALASARAEGYGAGWRDGHDADCGCRAESDLEDR